MATTPGGRAAEVASDAARLQKLEEQLDPEMQFRPLTPRAGWLVAGLLLALSCFHYYTAGFGLLPEATHRGVHLSFVLGLIFLVFPWRRSRSTEPLRASLLTPFGIPVIDWAMAIAAVIASLYLPWVFHDLQFRVGNPDLLDWIMGSVMLLVLLEATRRSVGPALPIISLVLIAYAMAGPSLPGILAHPGNTWKSVVNHLYLTGQGVYGIALGVVATYVFHYVLFGVLATRIGLGRLFIDLATSAAGRFSGGPAKVSIFASGLFGMISGSSIANTVTVGSLTIPMMIRIGYPRHFAGAVESTAATGGQITPPIMGAAAFLMVEYLSLPYQTIIIAAIVPAFMHFFGVFCQVHFEAKKLGMQGIPPSDLPSARLRMSLLESLRTLTAGLPFLSVPGNCTVRFTDALKNANGIWAYDDAGTASSNETSMTAARRRMGSPWLVWYRVAMDPSIWETVSGGARQYAGTPPARPDGPSGCRRRRRRPPPASPPRRRPRPAGRRTSRCRPAWRLR